MTIYIHSFCIASSRTGKRSLRVANRKTARMASSMHIHDIVPVSVLTDSYKASHYLQYPDAKRMVAVCLF